MNQQAQTFSLEIPQGVNFSDLDMTSEPNSYEITLNMVVVEHILKANNINLDETTDESDFIGALLFKWYQAWLSEGGEQNTTMDSLLAEIETMDRLKPEIEISKKTHH